jgi:hypothetical protein
MTPSTKRLLIIIICLAVLVRIIAALILGNRVDYLPSIADQTSYQTLAERILDGHGFTFAYDWWPATRAGEPTAHWSYFYTLYLALAYELFGLNPLVARLIQAVAGGILMPWLAFRLASQVYAGGVVARPVGRPRFKSLAWLNRLWQEPQSTIALLAAAWVGFYGYFIYFAAALMTETFYLIGILWTLDCALRIRNRMEAKGSMQPSLRAQRSNPIWNWLELGAAISITAMLRQVFFPFVPFLFLWLLWVAYRQLRAGSPGVIQAWGRAITRILPGALATILVMVILIAPITLFNYRQFGAFVLLNTNAGYAFFWSNHPVYGSHYVSLLTDDMPGYYDLVPKEVLWMNEAQLDRELLKRGLGFVAADPLRYLLLSLDRIPAYFIFWPKVTSGLVSNITRVISYGIAFPFIILGIGLWINDMRINHPRRRQQMTEPGPGQHSGLINTRDRALEAGSLLLLFAFVYTMVHLLSWAGIRYRLPVDVVTLIFAARGLYTIGKGFIYRVL